MTTPALFEITPNAANDPESPRRSHDVLRAAYAAAMRDAGYRGRVAQKTAIALWEKLAEEGYYPSARAFADALIYSHAAMSKRHSNDTQSNTGPAYAAAQLLHSTPAKRRTFALAAIANGGV